MQEHTTGAAQKRGLKVFRLGGIQVRLDYSWFFIFALVLWSLSAGYFPRTFPNQDTATYWISGLVATLLFFASILIHELSHAFVARAYGIGIKEITLFIFGGMANIAKDAHSPKVEFNMAIVGPLTSFLLAALFWVLAIALPGMIAPPAIVIFEYLAWINLALGIFNLLPGFPLDGGRIFRALWWWKTGSLAQATRVASDIGKGLAVVLMAFGALQIFAGALVGGLWFIFIGMFLRGIAEGSYQELVLRQSLDTVQAREIMIEDAVSVPAALPLSSVISDYFLRYGFRGFPVTRDGQMLGLISLDEVKKIPAEERERNSAAAVMIPRGPAIEIAATATLTDALAQMGRHDTGRLLVVDRNQPVGMITKTGLMRYWEASRALGTAAPA